MGLLSIFQRNKQTAPKPAKSGRAGKAARQAPQPNFANAANPADTAEAVREARARARRRLMGATVLLLVGVIGFPLLFETQPRPIPVDLPIEIPSRTGDLHASGATTLPLAATQAASGAAESVTYDTRQAAASAGLAASTAASTASSAPSAFASLAAALTPGSHTNASAAPASVAAPATVAVASAPASTAQQRAYISPAMQRDAKHLPPDPNASGAKPPRIALPPAPAPSKATPGHASTATVASTPSDTGATAAALLNGGNAPDAAAGSSRFVVQIGAFADDAKMHEARGKVEKLGLRTYTQSVDTPGGKRVRLRVGPFPTKAEADRTAAKIKADGLPAAVLVL